jgi:ribonuclease BN (tRNA processing enzyme)
MKIQILGAHNIESRESRFSSLLIDDVLAIDAGALTSSLSQAAQRKLKAVILTHQHYDHIRDVPSLGINFYLFEDTLDIFATQATYKVLQSHLLNDIVYANYMTKPPEKPSLRFREIEAGKEETISGYSVFYTADTGPGLTDVWRQVSPDLLIIEVTTPNGWRDFALKTGHLTPELLQPDLESFREIKGYLPQIVLVHMNPIDETKIKEEIAVVAKALKTEIQIGYEGMILRI